MPTAAIILCDDLGHRLSDEHGAYEELYERLINPSFAAVTPFDIEVYRAHEGELPVDLGRLDLIVVGGSRAGVYEDHPWIQPLLSFIRSAHTARVNLVGICFGHQAVAAALGAKVTPFEGGWNLARHEYRVDASAFGLSAGDVLGLNAFHRDQVREVPTGTEVFLSSDRCAIAGLVGEHLLTFQPHPEFSASLTESLLAAGEGIRFADEELADARARLKGDLSNEVISATIRTFTAHRAVV